MRPMVTYTQDAASQGVQESDWLMCDSWVAGPVGVQVDVLGPVTYTVFSTMDDPNSPDSPVPVPYVTWFPYGDPSMNNSNLPAQGYFYAAPRYVKLVQTAGTGTCILTVVQNGSAPY